MMCCIAIDDEPLALLQISKYIEKTPFLELAKGFNNGIDTLEFLSTEKIDLIFIDINMPDISGIDIVKSLKKKPIIIFTTAYSEFALDGYRVDALDYLLKPFSYEEFLKSANKALFQFNLINKETTSTPQIEFIFVKADYKMIKVFIKDIIYIEAQSEYIKIYRKNDKAVMTLLSMKAIEELLPSDLFLRIHRSYIINLQEIKTLSKGRVCLDKDLNIPIGEQYKNELQQYADKYLVQ
ncbi:DNA-binding LytR/AlgR family response regulator [Dysgonomonadaceae bacterium PH5-43]|nr:DNA-binding LytR/AlgR family response regulator [Dysgonomonadaceae bacterium PH5-43]